ncbi:MAG: ethylbenzene dehydrogenase-related protein [Planctomycetota bacterium]
MRKHVNPSLTLVAVGCGCLLFAPLLQSCGGDDQGASARSRGEEMAEALRRGRELYQKHCLACHGEKGYGDGTAAYLLYPKPRDFAGLEFRLISTDNGFPSDGDLLATITGGMPGSAMPPWGHLAEDDRWALVHYVKKLARDGKIARLVADGSSREEAEEIAREQCVPGKPVVIPEERPAGQASLARGKVVYAQLCKSCHDEDGRGRRKRDLLDSEGYPIFARDFTKGIFKGGASAKALATRFIAGMPGTPMPSFETQFEQKDDLWAVVHYIRSFVEKGAQERVQQRRTELVAMRTGADLGADAEGAPWSGVAPVWLALMPLWWRDDRVEGVRFQALHDGKRLAVRLSWEDATRDDHQVGQQAFGDSAAIQWSADEDPPFFGMGAKAAAVNIWHWKASWEADMGGFRDVQFSFPNVSWDLYPSLRKPPFGRHSPVGEFATSQHKPEFLSGWGAGNPMSDPVRSTSAEDLSAEGFGTLTSRPRSLQTVSGKSRWQNGTWEVVFVRPLAASGSGSIGLEPGASSVSVGFAVWDGSSKDRDGQKSVSIWHRLRLER